MSRFSLAHILIKIGLAGIILINIGLAGIIVKLSQTQTQPSWAEAKPYFCFLRLPPAGRPSGIVVEINLHITYEAEILHETSIQPN